MPSLTTTAQEIERAVGGYARRYQAQTGTIYLRFCADDGREVVCRVADHGDCYETAHVSCDPDGLTAEQAARRVSALLADRASLDQLDDAIAEMERERRSQWAASRREIVAKLGGPARALARRAQLQAKLHLVHDDGTNHYSGLDRRDLTAQIERLDEALSYWAKREPLPELVPIALLLDAERKATEARAAYEAAMAVRGIPGARALRSQAHRNLHAALHDLELTKAENYEFIARPTPSA